MAVELNTPQSQAKHYVDGPLLVLAGAGSGKTRVIVEKIAWLIAEGRYFPREIAAITFTNKSAKEMRERVQQLVTSPAEGLIISTFHALGLRFLQQESQLAGLRRNFSVLAEDESRALMKDLAPKGIKTETLNLYQALISRAKNALQTPDDLAKLARSPREQETAKLYGAYEQRLHMLSALDFDDLIARPVRLLRAHDELRERWRAKLRYLLVDEYQDTNAAQFELMTLLSGPRGAFTAVGDDDQSIYAWRGANPENLSELKVRYPNLHVIKLEQNYRCSGRILEAANALIAHNPHVIEKKLWSQRSYGDAIRLKTFASDAAEAEFVAGDIANTLMLERRQYNDFAVLYRGNFSSRALELAFRALSVPYQISGGNSLFDRQEIRDLMAHLRLLCNASDDVAFVRAIRAPKRDIGDTSLDKLAQAAQIARVSLLQACGLSHLTQVLQPRAAASLKDFYALHNRLLQSASTASPGEIAQMLMRECGYLDWLKLSNKDASLFERRKELLDDFIGWLKNFAKGRGIEALNAALMQISLSGKEDKNENAVRLMTLHSAKGLEFDHVYIIGVDDGTFPHEAAVAEGRIEEERRLLYVGITRAKHELTLSYPLHRTRYGESETCEPSRFIAELPARVLDAEFGTPMIDPLDRQKQLAQSHMAAMRAMLAD